METNRISNNFKIDSQIPAQVLQKITLNERFETFKKACELRCGQFSYDSENYEIINKLISYFARSERFEQMTSNRQVFSLQKGILLIGNTGSGKTELMRIFQGLVRNLETAFCFDTANTLVYAEFDKLRHKNLCIDDLGKEDYVSDYGVKRDVMSEVIFQRYDGFKVNGTLTHFTTQLSEIQITEKYGAHILGRLKEMCNIFILGGNEAYTDRRNRKTPFIPMPVASQDFPLFYPKYLTVEKQLEIKARQEMKAYYAQMQKEAEERIKREAEMTDSEKQENRIGELMKRFGYKEKELEYGKI